MHQEMIVHTSQFWPTVGRVGAVVAAIFGGASTTYANLAKKKADQIMIKVNGELHQRIEDLREAAGVLQEATNRNPQMRTRSDDDKATPST